MKGYSAIGAIALGLAFAPAVEAVPFYGEHADYEGTRSTDSNGLEFIEGDRNNPQLPNWDLILEWSITDNNDGTLDYEYTFSPDSGQTDSISHDSISHLTLDLSDNCVDSDGLSDPGCVTNAQLDGDSLSSDALEFGDIDGISSAVKFDAGDDLAVTYSFTSNRAPVWGDTFIKEGTWDAQNVGFGDTNLESETAYVARPNGTAQVPAPGTLALMAFGLLGLSWFSRRTRKGRASSSSAA
ncbi:PEP-CTERM sorting domain-containing protein [Thiohalorhabdus sp.]|uniref:PEP-CTERM sorting domain-containing protein n=1 Tax=Thiohalorhabdus sp. TaxID=3094134 RepID=UPI002FC2A1A4